MVAKTMYRSGESEVVKIQPKLPWRSSGGTRLSTSKWKKDHALMLKIEEDLQTITVGVSVQASFAKQNAVTHENGSFIMSREQTTYADNAERCR